MLSKLYYAAIALTVAGIIPGHRMICLSPCLGLNVRLLDLTNSGVSVIVFENSVVSCHRLVSNLYMCSCDWDR